LVAKGYTQICDLNYGDTFSLMVKIVYVRVFIAMKTIEQASFSIAYQDCFSSWQPSRGGLYGATT